MMKHVHALVGHVRVPTGDGRQIYELTVEEAFVPIYDDTAPEKRGPLLLDRLVGHAQITRDESGAGIIAHAWIRNDRAAELLHPDSDLRLNMDLRGQMEVIEEPEIHWGNLARIADRNPKWGFFGSVAALHIHNTPAWDDLWVKDGAA